MSEPTATMYKESSLKVLIVKRSSIKGQITKFKNYLDNITKQPQLMGIEVAELSLKISRFENLSTKYDELQTQIELANADNLDDELDERERIEQDFIMCTAMAKNIIEEQNELKNLEQDKKRRESLFQDAQCGRDHNNENCITLPQIQIAKFDGSFFRWLEFRDTFNNLVHNNSRISLIQKFHYLVSYLEGDAARVISNIEVSAANYNSAYQLLYDRYNNKRLLINYHIKSLFNIEKINRESDTSLRSLVDHVSKNLRALANLGQPTDHWDTLIIHLVSSKLDTQTLVKWEEQRNSLGEIPTLNEFNKFLIDRAYILECTRHNKTDQGSSFHNNASINNNSRFQPSKPVSHHHHNQHDRSILKSYYTSNQNDNNSSFKCIICNQNHRIYDCQIFKSKSRKDKLIDISKHKLCINCLRQGHSLNDCRLGPCKICEKRHNTLLHPDDTPEVNNASGDVSETLANYSNKNSNRVILTTAQLYILNPITREPLKVRALLDSGSQSSFITKSLQQKLAINPNPVSIKAVGIGHSDNKIKESCVIQLQSIYSNYKTKLNCLVLDRLTGDLPKAPINIQNLNIPTHLHLADPDFNQPAPVDLLIGADLFWQLIKKNRIYLGSNKPILQNSRFGWLIGGPNSSQTKQVLCNYSINNNFKNNNKIDNLFTNSRRPRKFSQRFIQTKSTSKLCQFNTLRFPPRRFSVGLSLLESADSLDETYTGFNTIIFTNSHRYNKHQRNYR